MHQSDLSFAPRIQPCSMELQTKVEDAKVEVPETDASIFGPSMATPAPPPLPPARNLSSQSGYESKILFINFSWVIPCFLKVEDAKVKVLETES